MKENIKIGLFGILGKMGQTFLKEVQNSDGLSVIFGVDPKGENESCNVPIYNSSQYVCRQVDVVVDFSNHAAIRDILKFAIREKIPAVICSTGHTTEELMEVQKAAKIIPILLSPNMSNGANFLIDFAEKYSKYFVDNGYQIDISEKHHTEKKDRPSGTALAILQAILSTCPTLHLDKNLTSKREKDTISIHSMRIGSEIGTHELIFSNNNEIISLSHKIDNRAVFAHGAIDAVRFIIKQKPGYYTSKDMISKKVTNHEIGDNLHKN